LKAFILTQNVEIIPQTILTKYKNTETKQAFHPYKSTMKLNLLLLSAAAMVNAATATATAPVDLKTAGNYVMLAKSGISTVPTSSITGDIGVSPIAATAITGFSLVLDSAGQHSTSSQVTGEVHAASYGLGVAAELTQAVLDMQAAYTDASSRLSDPSDPRGLNFKGGLIGGQTLTPGVYTFTVAVTVASDLTFSGGPDDIWIIKTTAVLTLGANVDIILVGGAQAKNIIWQGAVNAAIGAGASMAGIMLMFTDVLFATGSSLEGQIYSQTAINIQMATITQAETITPAEVECRSASDCGDTTLFTCESNECKDIQCNTGQTGVECCGASDCGDTNLFTCESDQCVSFSCDTEKTGVECCEDSECGDIGSFHCQSNSCVLRDCKTSLQDVECCADDDCSSGGSSSIACVSNVCINNGDPRFTLTWFGDGKLLLLFSLHPSLGPLNMCFSYLLVYL
jgi:hypothetical protein